MVITDRDHQPPSKTDEGDRLSNDRKHHAPARLDLQMPISAESEFRIALAYRTSRRATILYTPWCDQGRPAVGTTNRDFCVNAISRS